MSDESVIFINLLKVKPGKDSSMPALPPAHWQPRKVNNLKGL
jgi:hypothetical protein